MASGGLRAGAGRPKGSKDKATLEQKATISDLAKALAPQALKTLAEVMKSGASDAARVAAANSILDRAYGKPVQSVEHVGKEGGAIPFSGFLIERAQPDTSEAD